MEPRRILMVCIAVLILPALSGTERKMPPHHLAKKTMEHTNRLIKEKSPYLLQHAHNPVDWYPWGKEAFQKAQKENKPIFLSIGYSTCHWCHVMEHESFEDEEIAGILNDYFVPIKVDREERPDLDHIYMTAVSAMTGQGGWPLNVFLTPDKKPFYGGTYFPSPARLGMPGFKEVLHFIHEAWENRREEIVRSSDSLLNVLQEQTKASGTGTFSAEILHQAFRQFLNYFDETYGGFGQSPKFPSSHNLSFLLCYWKRTANTKALGMVEKTLLKMHQGGMYDHLGGGFHRYSTDSSWQMPHFEKMLYDQAILSRTYLEAYQATANPLYRKVAQEIFEYVLRDMKSGEGGFFSAEDADSFDPHFYPPVPGTQVDKSEGAFYLWRYKEIVEFLGNKDSEVFNYYFGIKPDGNAQFDPHAEFVGKNILYIAHSLFETAKNFSISEKKVDEIITRGCQRLLQERLKRPRVHLDDKILVDWNGLMISSLALGGEVLDDPRYIQSAEDACHFLLHHLKTKDGRLLHRYRDGEAAISATLNDYAFLIHGLLDLYEASFKVEYLKEALNLADQMVNLFWDEKNGGFFLTAPDREDIILRQKEVYDGAYPSGNSIAALDMIRLAHFTLNPVWEKRVQRLFASFLGVIESHPSAYAQMLIAMDFFLGPSREIIIAGIPDSASTKEMLKILRKKFLPGKVVIFRPVDEHCAEELISLIPSLKTQLPIDNKTTAYVCKNHVCQLPTTSLTKFEELLQ